ncbi:MAG: hypothetical protein E7419_01080 [Ruminococcaceae bacterium]|nr:hypothetical protein [Oscillospiraceae bacterium]
MKFKNFIAAVCAFSLLLAPSVSFAKSIELTLESNDIYVNDGTIEKKTVEVAPFTENGRTLVPVRIVSENLGLNVGWDNLTKTVTISGDALNIKLVIGSNIAYVNNEEVSLDVPAIEKDGRTLVPVRFISETLGKKVKWIASSNQILITDEKPLLKAGSSEYTLEHYIGMMALYGYNVEYITLMLTEIGKIKEEAVKNGYVFKNNDTVKQTYQELISIKDEVYAISLIAPLIELIEDSVMASEYLDTFTMVDIPKEEITKEYTSSYICAKHILIPTTDSKTGEEFLTSKKNTAKKVADTVIAKIKSGEDFDTLIEKYNEDPGVSYNPLGYVFTKGEMVKEFEETAFSLKEGEISGIVETPYGYHIIKREKLPEISEDVYTQIENSLIYNKGMEKYEECLKNNSSEQYVTDTEINNMINSMLSEEQM